mmetsp:Transcript_479/g.446  ORF Transcript_479/g.446 Transcript_479/m.446 type:complete len:273 (+) Transcript_479:71-889(+)|eukprot:CAMPEP_0114595210 /NCGR_PEP_ID=MMETSP0125-20121206/16983_1 /TAXON_ID=485358 ORGANISM="Aristerostoma sp., Strain ATCC 50986" /NCGR_SAMPLE_ID=MMETSP0125 /ASSEMBLY_ACC=CAM_ASM_000245 /LENGTH=272 /DNA_ID=CAMNT_0001796519 /DNA_START=45 /DNA_END=863 /DNA_ORIENTATION=-
MVHKSRAVQLFAEFFGLFILLVVVHDNTNYPISAFTFGFTLMCLIKMFADVSGAELNGAISMVEYFAAKDQKRETDVKRIQQYIAAQVAGGVAAGIFLKMLAGQNELAIIRISPTTSVFFALFLETTFTMLICFSVCLVISGKIKPPLQTKAAVIIGGTVGVSILLIGDKTGGCVNPSIAMALIIDELIFKGTMDAVNIVVYVIGPLLSAYLAVQLFKKYAKWSEEAWGVNNTTPLTQNEGEENTEIYVEMGKFSLPKEKGVFKENGDGEHL